MDPTFLEHLGRTVLSPEGIAFLGSAGFGGFCLADASMRTGKIMDRVLGSLFRRDED